MKPLYKPELEHLVGKIKADLSSKQDKLTAGNNITITSNTISATDTVYDDTSIQTELGKKADKTYVDNKVKTDVPENAVFTDTPTDISGKQDKLTAGDNITITNNTISATDTVYDDTAVQAELGKKADKTYVDNKVQTDVPSGAKFTDTVYTHPASHPASMITESSTKRFVSDSEKSTWNSKSDTDTVTTINGKTGAISKADIVALGIPSQDTNTTYTEISTNEIDEGTSSALRVITGRRMKHALDKKTVTITSATEPSLETGDQWHKEI